MIPIIFTNLYLFSHFGLLPNFAGNKSVIEITSLYEPNKTKSKQDLAKFKDGYGEYLINGKYRVYYFWKIGTLVLRIDSRF